MKGVAMKPVLVRIYIKRNTDKHMKTVLMSTTTLNRLKIIAQTSCIRQ